MMVIGEAIIVIGLLDKFQASVATGAVTDQ